jgi:glycosyltransferase involved in cell wall biosynthesis
LLLIKKIAAKAPPLKKGFLNSTGDIIIVQDADLEYSPNDYPLLLEPFVKYNADAVYGSRFITNRPHRVLYFWHYLGNLFLTTLSNMFTNLNLTDMETGYKIFRGDLIRKLAKNLKSKRFGFEPEITAKLAKIKNIKIYEVGITYQGRTYEEGKKINWKDGFFAVWEIVRFNLFDS